MIFDTLNNLPNYLGISPNLDTAIEFFICLLYSSQRQRD